VRERLKASYSETGRPSIDPKLLLRILLIGYLYGVTSERRLVEELRMHLAWFTGLGFDQESPHYSTFSAGMDAPHSNTLPVFPNESLFGGPICRSSHRRSQGSRHL